MKWHNLTSIIPTTEEQMLVNIAGRMIADGFLLPDELMRPIIDVGKN